MNTTHIQTIYTFCKVCECRLYTPEEWGRGLCASHAMDATALPQTHEPDWNAILEAIDASQPRAFVPHRPMKRD